jgi:DNA helicase HerA-like ATPase
MRLTNPDDQNYVKKVSENVTESDLSRIRTLSKGEAFLFGTAVPISLPVKINTKHTEHGGYTPPIREEMDNW